MEKSALNELVNGILNVMESQLVRIILYGSVARGTHTSESDVDIALLTNGTLNKDTEEMLSCFIVEMNLKYDKVFSVIDIEYNKFCQWESVTPFYSNVSKEGIVLWQVA